MGEDVKEPPARRGRTLALTLFGAAFFTVTMTIAQAVPYVIYLPNSTAGLGWILYLFMLPTVVTGILAGFTASLGAYIGRRMTTTPPDALTDRTRMSLGAGVGGAVGSSLFLIYLSWMYQGGPGLCVGVLGFMLVFGAYAGFTALWLGRRARKAQLPA